MTNKPKTSNSIIENWDESEELPPKLNEIRHTLGDNVFKNSHWELIIPAIAGTIYSLPGLVAFTGIHKNIPAPMFSIYSISFILVGLLFYIVTSGKSGEQDELAGSYDVEVQQKDWPQTFPVDDNLQSMRLAENLDNRNLTILLREYQIISEEARYRDRLINRSAYFALAVIAGFGVLFERADPHELPIITMMLSLSMFFFAMALVKYKDARDPLWKRQRDLERLVPAFKGRLTTFHTIRTPKRRILDRFSMSSYLTNIYLMLTFLSVVGYMITIIRLP